MEPTPSDAAPKTAAAGAATSRSTLTAAATAAPAAFTPLFGGAKIVLAETPKAVTPFGGLGSFIAFLQQIGFGAKLAQVLPFAAPTSPNAIPLAHTFTAFFFAVVTGASRFAHTDWLRGDRALHTLLGIARFPGDDTMRVFFLQPVHARAHRGLLAAALAVVARLGDCDDRGLSPRFWTSQASNSGGLKPTGSEPWLDALQGWKNIFAAHRNSKSGAHQRRAYRAIQARMAQRSLAEELRGLARRSSGPARTTSSLVAA